MLIFSVENLFIIVLTCIFLAGTWGCYHAIKDITQYHREQRETKRKRDEWISVMKDRNN